MPTLILSVSVSNLPSQSKIAAGYSQHLMVCSFHHYLQFAKSIITKAKRPMLKASDALNDCSFRSIKQVLQAYLQISTNYCSFDSCDGDD